VVVSVRREEEFRFAQEWFDTVDDGHPIEGQAGKNISFGVVEDCSYEWTCTDDVGPEGFSIPTRPFRGNWGTLGALGILAKTLAIR
jgi:hypothetical protein